jgi:predicted site-specific integrase-resolvase
MFQISTVSLDKWRRKGLLPDPIKQGRKIYYLRSEIERMIIERKQYYVRLQGMFTRDDQI